MFSLGLVFYVPANNLSVISRRIYLGGTNTKQRVKCMFALMFFVSVNNLQSCRDDFLSFCVIPVSVSCSRTQNSDTVGCEYQTSNPSIPSLTLFHLSHCAQNKANIVTLITFILLDRQPTTIEPLLDRTYSCIYGKNPRSLTSSFISFPWNKPLDTIGGPIIFFVKGVPL